MTGIDRRSVILGSLISLLLFAGYAHAQTVYNYSIGVVIEIPAEGGIVVTGLRTDDYGNQLLPKMVMTEDTSSTRFTITNTGSVDYIITKSITSPTNLELSLSAYIEHSTVGDSWIGDSFTLKRGTSADVKLTVVDLGAEPGLHDATIVIGANPS